MTEWRRFCINLLGSYRRYCGQDNWAPYTLTSVPGRERFLVTCDLVRAYIYAHPNLTQAFSTYGDRTRGAYGDSIHDPLWQRRARRIARRIAILPIVGCDESVVAYITGPVAKHLVLGDMSLMKKSMVVMTPEQLEEEKRHTDIPNIDTMKQVAKNVNGRDMVNNLINSRDVEQMAESLSETLNNAIRETIGDMATDRDMREIRSAIVTNIRESVITERSADPVEQLRDVLRSLQTN